MDRNSIIGLLLIGAIMIGFTIINKPDREALEIAKKEQIIQDSLNKLSQSNEQVQNIVNLSEPKPDSLIEAELKDQFGDFSNALKGESYNISKENDLVSFTFNSKGGVLKQVAFKDFKTWTGEPLAMFHEDSTLLSFAIPADNRIINTSELYFKELASSPSGNGDQIVTLRSSISESEYIDFIYTIPKNSYKLDFKVDFSTISSRMSSGIKQIDFNWSALGKRQEKNLDNERNNTTVYYNNIVDDDVDKVAPFEAASEIIEDSLQWIGFKEQFFASVLISKQNILPSAKLETYVPLSSDSSTKGMSAAGSFPWSGSTLDFSLYTGPTKYDILKSYGNDLEDLVPLGWGIFGWVNKIIVLPAFRFLGQFNLGYGLVILLLTLYIKMILLIFQYRSYLSQAKMRVLKPEIDEINKKFENGDAMQKQQATMSLYKEAGVNPLGGCVPMLFQIPVLFALFSFFPASIELRQESFLWADDLSTYDSILDLPFEIPFYGDHISLFALLMTISTILYTRMNSQLSAGNAQMMPGLKWMMYLMPVIFLFVLNSYAAGLNYYYFLANIITFGQQFAFRKFVDDEKIHAKIQEKKNKPKSASKSSFQQKLEEMAKARALQSKKK